jgi:hypothetical protein
MLKHFVCLGGLLFSYPLLLKHCVCLGGYFFLPTRAVEVYFFLNPMLLPLGRTRTSALLEVGGVVVLTPHGPWSGRTLYGVAPSTGAPASLCI